MFDKICPIFNYGLQFQLCSESQKADVIINQNLVADFKNDLSDRICICGEEMVFVGQNEGYACKKCDFPLFVSASDKSKNRPTDSSNLE